MSKNNFLKFASTLFLLLLLINNSESSWIRQIQLGAGGQMVLEYQQNYVTRYDHNGTIRFAISPLNAIVGNPQSQANRNQAIPPAIVIIDRISPLNNTAANVQAMFTACTGNFINQNGNNAILPAQLTMCFNNVQAVL